MEKQPKINVKAGQIWQEVDPRCTRIVEVVEVNHECKARPVVIKTVIFNGVPTMGRENAVKMERFDGRRGGYKYLGTAWPVKERP